MKTRCGWKTARRSNRAKGPDSNCNLLTIIPWNDEAARAYAKLRVELEAAGMPIGNMDMLIAASAIAENAILVTNNVEHFSKVVSLKIENWC